MHEFHTRFDRYRPLAANHVLRGWKEMPGQHNEAIYNLGSHIIDQAITLFGVPDRVWCRSYDERGLGLDEAFEMQLIYPPQPGGAAPLAVYLGASILASTPEHTRYLVKGAKGSFHKLGLDPQEPLLRAGGRVSDKAYGVEDEDAWGSISLCEDDKWTTTK